jgi:nucleoside-diphosphate-sugar epimerase
MKIGITGHKGFIGSSVLKKLLMEDHEVVFLDKYTRSSIIDDADLKKYPDDLDWVLHFGARTSIRDSFENPFFTYANNTNSTLQAVKIACKSNAVLLFMSSYIYGNPRYLPIDEKHPVAPTNPYMGSKITGEEICRQLSKVLKFPLIILRAFNIYGDFEIPGRLISDLLQAVRLGNSLVLNDPVPKRDYLYIKDFEALLTEIISNNPPKTGTYNVGYGQSYSNLQVAEIVQELSGITPPIKIKSELRPNDIPDCTVDISLIKNTFAWVPKYSLREGLKELIHKNF